ncbi:MAG: hypothetical protein ABFD00_01660 [Chloroherpetonaceae bacterium]
MYTSYIGKKFLNYYNKKENTNLQAREFFDTVLFPLFFDNEKHLMHVSNSPFFQKPSKEFLKEGVTKSQAQLAKLHNDIDKEVPNMGTFVGYAAKDVHETTSGQVTDMNYKIDSEEMFASWIGESLSIGISGGFAIAIDNEELLYNIFLGAKYYREYLSKTPNVKDKQIQTWNGHWFAHYYSKNFDENNIWSGFELETKEIQGNIAIPTIQWTQIVFVLSKIFPDKQITIYAYNLSQTNTTLGFIQLYLQQCQRLYQFRDKFFFDKEKSILNDKQIEQFQTFYNFKDACKQGTIGLKSLEPKGLRDYIPIGSYPYSKGKDYKFKEESYLNYLIYKLWVIAMLNKQELLDLAEKMAKSLIENEGNNSKPSTKTSTSEELNKASNEEYSSESSNRGKTAKSRLSLELLESKNTKVFIENLSELMQKQTSNADMFKEVVKEVLNMPVDNFPLFVVLIKFEYYYQKSR